MMAKVTKAQKVRILYRAVSNAELTSILNSGKFKEGNFGFEGKQFGNTLEDVLEFIEYNRKNLKKGIKGIYDAIVKVSIGDDAYNKLYHSDSIDRNLFKHGVVMVELEMYDLFNGSVLDITVIERLG